jgi:hypothetical protein
MSAVIDAPIFNSVQQALHFSFLMEILPATQRSVMQALIDRLMEDMGIVQEREQGTINFGGLSSLEIRGQCAMIRGAVVHHLPAPEAHSIHARYGQQNIKAEGVRGIRDYAAPMLTTHADTPTLAIAWSIFGTKRQREGLSTHHIAKDSGLSQSTIQRDLTAMKNVAKMLEQRGIERLESVFAKGNLIISD